MFCFFFNESSNWKKNCLWNRTFGEKRPEWYRKEKLKCKSVRSWTVRLYARTWEIVLICLEYFYLIYIMYAYVCIVFCLYLYGPLTETGEKLQNISKKSRWDILIDGLYQEFKIDNVVVQKQFSSLHNIKKKINN